MELHWLSVKIAAALGLLAFVFLPAATYLCCRAAAIGRLSGERWFWLKHQDEIEQLEKVYRKGDDE
jgi:hypothetical protein